MKRILIVGKNSYIGSRLCSFVSENTPGCETFELDVQNDGWREFDFSGFDAVVIVAGIAHRKETSENAHLYYEVNRDLAYAIACRAKDDGAKQLIFLSTMSVYGVDEGVISLETEPCPKTAYGQSKLEAERLIQGLSDSSFRVTVLRPPMVYGPGCKGNFQSLLKIATMMPVFPNVNNNRSAIFVDNLCAFILQCIAKTSEGIFFPQDEEYLNTSEAARQIALANGRRIMLSRLLGALVIVGKPRLRVLRKAFGSLIYDDSCTQYEPFCVVTQLDAIRRSSIVDYEKNES